MNQRPLQITFAILIMLTLLLTACAPVATPTPTARPPSPPPPTHTPVPPTPTPVTVLHPGWTSYTNANYVSDMAFDRDGNLWTVGSGGVVKWDVTNNTYIKYTVDDGLADNVVGAIALAPDGALWFGTADSGVSRFDGESWVTYTTDDGLADNNDVRSIAVAPDGALWFGTRGGVSRFDGQSWTTYTTNTVLSIAVAPDGALWFGTEGSGVSRFDGESWTTYTKDDGLAGYFVLSIAVAPDGALWFGTAGGDGISRFDGKRWATYKSVDIGLASNAIWSIAVAPDGALWFGTKGSGVSRFDGESWTTYTSDNGLTGVTSIVVAPDGALWFGTQRSGISRFDGESWTTYITYDDLPSNVIRSLAVGSDGALWFTADPGVYRFDGEIWTTYTTNDGLADNAVQFIAVAPDGALWFGTQHGVSRFDGETWTTYTTDDGLADNAVQFIAVAPDGALWFGTQHGLSRFDGETWTAHITDDLTGITSIAVAPDGTLWLGTYGGGVSHFDGQTWVTYTTDDGLADNDILSITVTTDGALWCGTRHSVVSRFDGQTWTTHTVSDGLPLDYIQSIVVAPDSTLWFGTLRSGVSHFDGEVWTTYTTDDGLANNNVHSIAVSPDGTLWFSTSGGVSRYLPNAPAVGIEALDFKEVQAKIARFEVNTNQIILPCMPLNKFFEDSGHGIAFRYPESFQALPDQIRERDLPDTYTTKHIFYASEFIKHGEGFRSTLVRLGVFYEIMPDDSIELCTSQKTAERLIDGMSMPLVEDYPREIGGYDGWVVEFSETAQDEELIFAEGVLSIENHRRVYFFVFTAPRKDWEATYECMWEAILDSVSLETFEEPPAEQMPLEVGLYMVTLVGGLSCAPTCGSFARFSQAAADLFKLAANPLEYDEEQLIAIQTQAEIMRREHQILTEMYVPPEMAEVHNMFLSATSDCNEAASYITNYYATETGKRNLNDLVKASELQASCLEKLERTVELFNEYMAQFK